MIIKKNLQQGFTLIEMIVSVAIFSIVATITVGALLILISTNQQLQTEQNIMTNLSFALDSMTREIRTGTNYYCTERNSYSQSGPNNIFDGERGAVEDLGNSVQDCPSGISGNSVTLQGLAVVESGDSITGGGASRIVYFYDSGGDNNPGRLMRRIGNSNPESITSSGLDIVNAEFFVTGTTPGDDIQPTVTVVIEAKDINDPSGKTYQLQTTVVQRTLDI
jgi:prepilin-type N-terminal cleavage/methylation domain-containing protein